MHQVKSHKSIEKIAAKHKVNVSFIEKQLKMGIPIEHEHTKDKDLATDIALQHLEEIPDYYTRLKKMESSAKKDLHVKEHCGCEGKAVKELESGLKVLSNISYDSIDNLMKKIMKKHDMTAKQLHNSFVNKHKKTPDTWIKDMKESLEVAKQGLEGKRYCKLCRKSETQQECKFGPEMWNKFSIATVHPANMPEEYIDEKKGLWDNIHARRKAGKPPKKPGEKGYPKTLNIDEGLKQARKNVGASKCWPGKVAKGTKMKGGREVPNCVPAEDTCLSFSEFMAEVAAWQRKEGKNPEGGLNRKGIASYRRENPGSKLSMAVTTPPSKLDPDSKAAKRRKSFCARMGGVEGPMKDEKGRPTRKALALRKWNC